MGLESLTQLELSLGLFTFIWTLISLLVGVRIFSKYFSQKQKELLTVGLAWIFLSSAWWGSAFSFLSIIISNQPLDTFSFLFLGNFFLPIAICCWIYSFCNLGFPSIKKILLPVYLVICVIFDIFLLVFLFTDPRIVGSVEGNFYSQPNLFALVFQLFAAATTIVTGLIFSIDSIKSDDSKVKLKGKFLLLAFVSFTIGALFDAAIPLNIVSLVIVRLILISSGIEYYLGFLMPDKLAKALLKSKT
ncbi:MAG: hypothetical protein GF383_01620 [Candidatus Lokiarchaeota archaeon]|nr:hypothetical protein [Candidatus Lokiarchaeota archaeon]MBD3337995.1 hypothetical protein [Candidatus Lokiarchaeota archaeon]